MSEGLLSFAEAPMPDLKWQRLTEVDIARCACGASYGHPEHGTITWWIERPAYYVAPRPCHAHRCKNRGCRRVYWAVSVDVALAGDPPELLPLSRTG